MKKTDAPSPADMFAKIFDLQREAGQKVMATLMPAGADGLAGMPGPSAASLSEAMPAGDLAEWGKNAAQMQKLWAEFAATQAKQALEQQMANPPDPMKFAGYLQEFQKKMPLASPADLQSFWQDASALWTGVISQFATAGTAEVDLPRKDRRFKDDLWRTQPAYALIHQTYLLMAEQMEAMVDRADSIDAAKRKQLKFATRALIEALSPANFAATNPVVLERAKQTKGASMVKGMQHLLADMKRGQLTHTDPDAFTLGENIATSPGKVVHETPLYQLIQYSPSTEEVLEIPLIIFPPWINRFYILDLNEKKSFVRWAVAQGITVFMVSWKSADASMRNVVWDDYIAAQIDAIDTVRERLKVPHVHTIGYCVAGTTLAATLAILHRRGEEDRVKSCTFFTAQVDFDRAGELLHFVDDGQLANVDAMSDKGYLDGRYMAATFNLLRSTDLIWNYVVNNYLMGEDYPAFDLLHWNGDVTNLPAKWHGAYLRDLYRDNKLVQKDALAASGTPIDLSLVKTPTYVQAGKEDHIAPAESVWRLREHFSGPIRFILAGSGHIAGVVNPPGSGKYQYWTNDDPDVTTLSAFREGATEHPGSWWPDWAQWLQNEAPKTVKATGKRQPGKLKSDTVIEDAPGRYVMSR
ncbi:PHA/PHB synthase family protein [Qipengyuania sp. DSG2-2]|uniref:PHA/PHB synthase family protein n=1 Tax=Qipengyuania sp. DGS2-2 TaxID=3349631 RepID=UPI0036D37A43